MFMQPKIMLFIMTFYGSIQFTVIFIDFFNSIAIKPSFVKTGI